MMDAHKFRNPVYNNRGTIDCEIYSERSKAWIEYTAAPDDVEEIGRLTYEAILASNEKIGAYIPPALDEQRAYMTPITPRQLRLALIRNGVSVASVDAAIASISDQNVREEAQVEWEYATSFSRMSSSFLRIMEAIGMTPDQVDVLWAQAEGL